MLDKIYLKRDFKVGKARVLQIINGISYFESSLRMALGKIIFPKLNRFIDP